MNISSNFSNSYVNFHNNFSRPKDQEEQKVVGLKEAKASDNQSTIGRDKEKQSDPTKTKKSNGKELTRGEEMQISKLKARDAEVRAHEAAHLAVAGSLAAGGASYTYQQGPDGKMYAIGGEVPINLSKGATPEQTAANMRKVRAAALAPSNPSGQDLKIASTAAMLEMKARMEIAEEKREELDGDKKDKNSKESNPYAINSLNPQDEQKNSLDFVA